MEQGVAYSRQLFLMVGVGGVPPQFFPRKYPPWLGNAWSVGSHGLPFVVSVSTARGTNGVTLRLWVDLPLEELRRFIDIKPYNHILTHMKTTLDLPDDLLIEAKAVAARRRTTLKAIVEHALRREIQPVVMREDDCFEAGPLGILSLKPRGLTVTSEMVYGMLEEEDL